MVLSSASRPLARSLGPIASRSRGLSSLASASAVSSLRNSSSRSGAVTSRQAAANSSALPGSICRSKLGPTMSIRSLTGFPREKVKVLMVLYDGGKHAEEVSQPSISLFYFNPNLPMRRRPTAALLASTGPRNRAANCSPQKRSDLSSLLARELPGWTRRCRRCYTVLCDATHYGRQPTILWPGRLVTGLRGSVLGREQG